MSSWTLLDADDRSPQLVDLDGAEVAYFSRRGPEKTHNEDAAAVVTCEGGCVLLVADGMGGHSAGDRASRLAVEVIPRRLAESDSAEADRHALLEGIEEANRAVCDLGVGAGATLVAVHVLGERSRSLHVGDAAALHVGQRGRVKARTIDHSPVAYAVQAGLLDEAEALHHGQRHVVTNYLGSADMRVDIGPSRVIARRDTLVLASDGLFDNLHTEEVVELIRRGPLDEAAQGLATLAWQRMLEPGEGEPSKPDDLTLVLYRRTR